MARKGIIRQRAGIVTTSTSPPPPPLHIPPPADPPRRSQAEVHYPDSDGSFLFENIAHSRELIYALEAVKRHLCDVRATVLVDVFLYYKEGDPKASVGPDLLVTLDHELKGTATYQTWVEGRVPDFVLEVVSPSSVESDKKLKKEVYERLGIREYFLYDPDEEQPGRAVKGYRLEGDGNTYGRALTAEADGSVVSTGLDLSLRRENSRLIVRNTTTGEDYSRIVDLHRRVDQLQSENDVERARADQADARAARIAAEMESRDLEILRLKKRLAARH